MAIVNENLYNINAGILPKDACIVIIRTQWNPEIVNKLQEGCVATLNHYGMNNYRIMEVPGAFEIPFAIKSFWDGYHNKFEKPTVFIALGCVLRGDTPHFDYVCKAVTDGLLHLNLILPAPSILGVLMVNNKQQADDRIGGIHGHKGEEAALSALKMIEFKYSIV
ncbi:MAG: 6,7-dimethyl-8-ribityllumazine synthase [Ginsengibacter sp.]